jgi:hypothetical protein
MVGLVLKKTFNKLSNIGKRRLQKTNTLAYWAICKLQRK